MSLSKATPAAKKSPVVTKVAAEKKPSTKKTGTSKPNSKPAPAKVAAATETKRKLPRKTAPKGNGASPITPEQRYRMICDAAYFRAERRGFIGGNSAEDWMAAEAEIDSLRLSMKH